MAAIVALHAEYVLGSIRTFRMSEFQVIIQLCKFGTICFFLISGFLMGERLPAHGALAYLGRRVRRLLSPWCFWLGALVAYLLATQLAHGAQPVGWWVVLNGIMPEVSFCLRSTAFWFVPNIVVAMCCVLLLRKRLNDLRVGAALFAVNLLYVANIYAGWFPSVHTEATFAYVFYLWLGAWCALNFEKVKRFNARISLPKLLIAIGVTALAGIGEARLLFKLGNPDPTNTLLLSNQLYSVLVALALLRVRRRTWPRIVDVGAHTYGVYLIHSLPLFAVAPLLARLLPGRGSVALGIEWLLISVVIYAIALGATIVFSSIGRLEWTVGNSKRTRVHARPETSGTSTAGQVQPALGA